MVFDSRGRDRDGRAFRQCPRAASRPSCGQVFRSRPAVRCPTGRFLHGLPGVFTGLAVVFGFLSCEPDEPELLRPVAETAAAHFAEADRAALVELYRATGGDDWRNNDGWLTDDSIGTWYGVTVEDDGVTKLDLSDNLLKGRVPKVVAELSGLRDLDLSYNGLWGEIPPELGDLSELRLLDLSGNPLSGPMPSELKGLSKLESMRIQYAGIEGPLPAWLGELTALTDINMSGSYFDSPIPPELGDSESLKWIYLSSAGLRGPIPPELGNLSTLEVLSLSYGNRFDGPIPPEFGRLENLRFLGIWGSHLSGPIPPELGGLKNLRTLWLNSNDLTGPIPSTFGGLVNLEWLDLSANQLRDSLPAEFGGLSKLEKLYLSSNKLEGGVPRRWGDLENLDELTLGFNSQLSGALPEALTSLDLSRMELDRSGLCVPRDSVFADWLESIGDHDASPCGRGDVGAYLVQATQSRSGSVPLVAGRKAVVRAFVTAADTVERFPDVKVRLYRNGAEEYVLDIPGKPGPVPGEVDEGDAAKSANGVVPGWVIEPGLEMVVEVDPDGEVGDSVEMTRRIPAEGRIEVDVREMPDLRLTVVPWLWPKDTARKIVDLTSDLTWRSEVLRDIRTLLPVGEMDLTVHEPVRSNSNSGFAALAEVCALRAMEGGSGYYMALTAQSYGTIGGVAHRPGWCGWSMFNGLTMAHELGHNMSLGHAPCRVDGDPRYPYAGGVVGTFGLDLELGLEAVVHSGTYEFMSYCGPNNWVADWHFQQMVRHRLRKEDDLAYRGGPPPSSRALLVWGGRDGDGGIHLNPAFWVDAPWSPPPPGGEYEVTGWSAAGERLFAVRFDMTEVADGEGEAGFAFALPARPEWTDGRLAEISLRGDGVRRAVLNRDTDRPSVILRDAATGRVRALLIDDSAAAAGSHAGLVAARSRGLPDPAGGRGFAADADTGKVAYVVVTPGADTVSVGDTVRFTATALDADSSEVEDAEFEWASRDTLVAVVDQSGLTTGRRRGRTVVTAAVGEVSGAAQVRVEQHTAKVVVRPEADTVSAGDTVGFAATALDARDSVVAGVGFEWSSSDTSVASVDRSGLVFGWEDGSAWIRARTDRGVSDSAEVTVEGESDAERLALSRVYFRLDGRRWWKSDNWLTDAPLEDWHGVAVDSESGRVSSLELYGNNLQGQLGPELGELTGLKVLNLSSNTIRGSIPPELWQLDRLSGLHLDELGLSGSLSPEIGKLTELWQLDLGGNGLSGTIPPTIGNSDELLTVDLSRNAFRGPIPAAIWNHRNIGVLSLEGNRLTGEISASLAKMANLQHLDVSGNLLTGRMPANWSEKLAALEVADNLLAGELPAVGLGKLRRLEKISLSGNAGLRGVLPAAWAEREQAMAVTVRGTEVCAPRGDTVGDWLRGNDLTHVPLCVAEEAAFAYLVQAVQSRPYPARLVAGEDALLRVFMTTGGEADMPLVRATFYEDGEKVHEVEIPASDTPIPPEVDEGDLAKSANAVIPGKIIEPGLEMVIEIDPDSALDDDLDLPRRIPAEGRLVVDASETPELDLTAIPFLLKDNPDSTVLERAKDLESDRLFEKADGLLPVRDVDVTVHETVLTTSYNANDLLRETKLVRVVEGGDGYYMGLFGHIRNGLVGVAEIGGWSFVTLARDDILAHELGHVMNLRHAPCGGAGWPDPNYPVAGGRVGSWGYDFAAEAVVPPTATDLMGYCHWQWISPYQFERSLDHRLHKEVQERRRASAAEPVLIVWGGVDADGRPYLKPAFFVEAPPELPGADGGEHRLAVRAAGGGTLFSLGFDMPETAHADGASSFVFAIPRRAGWNDAIESIRLEGPGGVAVLDRETSRPAIILRDPATGAVRGVLEDAPDSRWPGFDVVVSRGLPEALDARR